MADALNATERQYLLDAIDVLGRLSEDAPELRGYVHASFACCHSLCAMHVGIAALDGEEDLWAEIGGDGELSRSEAAAMQALAVCLRRVVNGCTASPRSFRSSLVASVRLAESFIHAAAPGAHLEAVV